MEPGVREIDKPPVERFLIPRDRTPPTAALATATAGFRRLVSPLSSRSLIPLNPHTSFRFPFLLSVILVSAHHSAALRHGRHECTVFSRQGVPLGPRPPSLTSPGGVRAASFCSASAPTPPHRLRRTVRTYYRPQPCDDPLCFQISVPVQPGKCHRYRVGQVGCSTCLGTLCSAATGM